MLVFAFAFGPGLKQGCSLQGINDNFFTGKYHLFSIKGNNCFIIPILNITLDLHKIYIVGTYYFSNNI